jgi:hypothetical protein
MSLIDDILEGFTNTIDDIRHNVVEQGWFGQETTSDIDAGTGIDAPDITAPEIEPPESLESIMEMFTPPSAEAEQDHSLEQEQGIDV